MRINKYIALATGMSRRTADKAISWGRVTINGEVSGPGNDVSDSDVVLLDGKSIAPNAKTTILFNKPTDCVVSRDGQGSRTIYDILPAEYRHLKPVGRLDKHSSGLLVLTNDGDLANILTHPKHQKIKIYEIELFKPLQPLHHQMISDYGVQLEDGPSKLQLTRMADDGKSWTVTMSEGRNRQIRRTFASVGYTVKKLHRVSFGQFSLGSLAEGECKVLDTDSITI